VEHAQNKILKKRFGWYYETPVTLGSVGWGSEQEIPLYVNV
jgi:hypothetical protein